MDRNDFLILMDKAYDQIVEINKTKGHDYAGEDDALRNFKTTAKNCGITPEQAWSVFASKHYEAIMTYCREGDVASEPIEGRVHDLILYSFLLLGLIEEKQLAAVYKSAGGTSMTAKKITDGKVLSDEALHRS